VTIDYDRAAPVLRRWPLATILKPVLLVLLGLLAFMFGNEVDGAYWYILRSVALTLLITGGFLAFRPDDVAIAAAPALLVMFGLLAFAWGAEVDGASWYILRSVSLTLLIAGGFLAFRPNDLAIRASVAVAAALEAKAEKVETLSDYVEAQLVAAAA
jgi:hypothetical protein